MPKDEKLLEHRDESFYEWGPALDGLKQKLYNDEGNTFLVSAPFGWGKSSFTNILINELKEEEKTKITKWDVNIIHTWKYELLDSSSVVSQLIFDLVDNYLRKIVLQKLSTTKGVKVKSYTFLKEYDFINKEIIQSHGKLLLKKLFEKITDLDYDELTKIHKTHLAKKLDEIGDFLKDNYISTLKFYGEFLEAFLKDYKSSTKHKDSKVVFIFRDCDRCSPENLIKIIDVIHHIDINNKIKFVVEADVDAIKSILCMKYHLGELYKINHEGFSPKAELLNGYLNKIFEGNYVIEKKYLNKTRLIGYLNEWFGFSYENFELITFSNFTHEFNQNYRFFKYHFEKILYNKLQKIKNLEKQNLIIINTLIYLYLINVIKQGELTELTIPYLKLIPEPHRETRILITYEANYQLWENARNIPANSNVDELVSFANSLKLKLDRVSYNVIRFPNDFINNNVMQQSEKIDAFNNVISQINNCWKEISVI